MIPMNATEQALQGTRFEEEHPAVSAVSVRIHVVLKSRYEKATTLSRGVAFEIESLNRVLPSVGEGQAE